MHTWAKSSLYLSVALIVVGFLLIYLAWNGAAEKDFIQGQFPYLLSGGLGGLGLILCGLTLVATQSFRRDVLSLQDHVLRPSYLGRADEPVLEGLTTLGFLAARTSRVQLQLIESAVTLRNPALLAKTVATLDVQSVYWKQVDVLGSSMGSPRDFDALLSQVTAHRWAPRVDSVFPLNEIAAAYARLDAADRVGKVVLDVHA